MNERFELEHGSIQEVNEKGEIIDVLTDDEVVDLLNNLHQENQELQEKIMKVKQSNNHYYTEYYRIKEENDNEKNDYRELFSDYVVLEEQNKQLQEKLKDANDEIGYWKSMAGRYRNSAKLVSLLNEQQLFIGRLQEENLYKNFKLQSVDDLKKLKNIFEICMILINGAIEDEDLELGYESVFQFERRIKKFNGD